MTLLLSRTGKLSCSLHNIDTFMYTQNPFPYIKDEEKINKTAKHICIKCYCLFHHTNANRCELLVINSAHTTERMGYFTVSNCANALSNKTIKFGCNKLNWNRFINHGLKPHRDLSCKDRSNTVNDSRGEYNSWIYRGTSDINRHATADKGWLQQQGQLNTTLNHFKNWFQLKIVTVRAEPLSTWRHVLNNFGRWLQVLWLKCCYGSKIKFC